MAKNNNPNINQLKNNISSLEGEMNSLNEQLSMNPSDMFPDDDLLPGLNDIEIFDYQSQIKEIQNDCEITLECLSSLYLNANDLITKNINNIIKNDALALADLKFSLFCSKRALINLMKQLDMGINDPELFNSVSLFQKEIRDSIKMLYDINIKMKNFYKDVREEIKDINKGGDVEDNIQELESDEVYHIVNIKELNKQVDEYMNVSKNKKK